MTVEEMREDAGGKDSRKKACNTEGGGAESEHPPLTSCSQKRSLLKNRKNGQFYLPLTLKK